MQQDNTIETALRQLESQQLPDMSHADAHWQQMQAMLQPATVSAKKKYWPLAIVAACFLGGVVLVMNQLSDKKQVSQVAVTSEKQEIAAPAPTDTVPKAQLVQKGDTLKLIYSQVTVKHVKPVLVKGNNIILTPRRTDTVYFNVNYVDCKDSIAKANAALMPQEERQQKLNLLFEQMEKKAEEWMIDNRLDTLLNCKEGTSLLIPAGSLGGSSEVTIAIKEFYKKSEFVLNQLTATSNKNQLVSGGMLHITASVNGSPVEVQPGRPIRIYMTDTSAAMQQMQLFTGEKITDKLPSAIVKFNEKLEDITDGYASAYINWIPQYRYFTNTIAVQQARILNLDDNYIELRERRKGLVAIYLRSKDSKLSKRELEQRMKEKYGDQYYKIKVKNHQPFMSYNVVATDAPPSIGDSVWIKKELADKWKQPYIETRMARGNTIQRMYDTLATKKINNGISALNNRYGINISRLGWINCDQFYNDRREKTEYVIQLGDTASNYYTMLVFDNLNSLLNGYISGTKVMFSNVPVGEPVTIVSIGINAQGKAVYSMQKALTGKLLLQGMQYEAADAATLQSSLSKMDR
jgi:hypothetical protein